MFFTIITIFGEKMPIDSNSSMAFIMPLCGTLLSSHRQELSQEGIVNRRYCRAGMISRILYSLYRSAIVVCL
jgi:hypothetical protein